jgi:hypothetical protein
VEGNQHIWLVLAHHPAQAARSKRPGSNSEQLCAGAGIRNAKERFP